jgi:hypothetical protein
MLELTWEWYRRREKSFLSSNMEWQMSEVPQSERAVVFEQNITQHDQRNLSPDHSIHWSHIVINLRTSILC